METWPKGKGPPLDLGDLGGRPGRQRGRRSGKAPVVLGLARGSLGTIPGFARVLPGDVTEFYRLFGLSWEDVLVIVEFYSP